jgi:hypothetical protein
MRLKMVGPLGRPNSASTATSGNDQSSLEEKIILLERQDGLRRG